MGRKTDYFTLIELMVVMAVIAILSSTLLPAVSKAREKVREISCVNNLKQIGYASFSYCDDFNDYVMPAIFKEGGNEYSWLVYLYNVDESIANRSSLQCPSLKDEQNFIPHGKNHFPDKTMDKASYVMNTIKQGEWAGSSINSPPHFSQGWGDGSDKPIKIQQAAPPWEKIYIIDSYAGLSGADASSLRSFLETDHGPFPVDTGTDCRDVGYQHCRAFNALFGDAHAGKVEESGHDQWAVYWGD